MIDLIVSFAAGIIVGGTISEWLNGKLIKAQRELLDLYEQKEPVTE
jgi:hypothetical protein